MALQGRVRGNAMRSWGVHVARLWGPRAPDRVRELLGLKAAQLPDVPTKKHWLPIWVQVRLPQVIADEWCHGNILEFESVFSETTGTTDKVMFWLASKVGPAAMLKRGGAYHSRVCDVGTCESDAGSGWARLEFQGADVFGNPTWRTLQIMGMRTMFQFLNRPLPECHGVDTGERGFILEMAWKD